MFVFVYLWSARVAWRSPKNLDNFVIFRRLPETTTLCFSLYFNTEVTSQKQEHFQTHFHRDILARWKSIAVSQVILGFAFWPESLWHVYGKDHMSALQIKNTSESDPRSRSYIVTWAVLRTKLLSYYITARIPFTCICDMFRASHLLFTKPLTLLLHWSVVIDILNFTQTVPLFCLQCHTHLVWFFLHHFCSTYTTHRPLTDCWPTTYRPRWNLFTITLLS